MGANAGAAAASSASGFCSTRGSTAARPAALCGRHPPAKSDRLVGSKTNCRFRVREGVALASNMQSSLHIRRGAAAPRAGAAAGDSGASSGGAAASLDHRAVVRYYFATLFEVGAITCTFAALQKLSKYVVQGLSLSWMR